MEYTRFARILALIFFSLPAALILSSNVSSVKGQEKPALRISPEMQRRWDFAVNRDLGRFRLSVTQKLVRIIYLVPSDKMVRSDYRTAIADSVLHLQNFYQNEMGNGNRFTLHSPIVEVYQTSHPASYYASTQSAPGAPQYLWFWENVLNDGLDLTDGGFNDPDNRWIFHTDADTACGQIIGGSSGVAVMSANGFRGLVGEQNIPACTNEPPDNGGRFRWIGGTGHELGHSFNLPHPPGCGGPGPAYGCSGGETAANSLMWVGYAFYPNTYLLPADKVILLNSGFFSNSAFVSVSGRVTRGDGRGVAGARVILTNQNESRQTLTNHFGYYRFLNVAGGATYFVLAGHKSHLFNAREVTANGDQINIDITAQ